ncbi:SDR family NAD(P)-dependent oxidoreductase [Litorivicinus lipolyticus]|uniref:SDR family NAD(P)-dependent oxidoreductase n=1 Tax=Litorivicinus lipolyticus TaxID=418701 RepID=A0A5Q2Q979_9GAMM|nr:SDR family NAD(P)-dependent oxidoreductase [Litorivicinus lipolyticus]QGG80778.1 SDR family NAD(P)-dependent oxidoreductase [Litorivicinus lipolyticus]
MATLIIGGTAGIGKAWAAHLRDLGQTVWVAARSGGDWRVDVTDEDSIQALANAVMAADEPLDRLIYTVGLLHADGMGPEKSIRQLQPANALRSFQINTLAPALIGKAFWQWLRKSPEPTYVTLSARVGSISDNRLGGWHSYRAAKAAQNMMMTNLAIELKRVNPWATIAMLHPGTVDTGLSKPFQAAVPAGKLFTPAQAAAQLESVVQGLTPAQTGAFIDWNHQPIPF